MKLQLTKDKTIEIHFPVKGGGSKGLSDVVGVEFNSGDPRGCPAVRLTRKRGVWCVTAAGFVPPPDGVLPTSWEEVSKQPTWALPVEFQAPYAALAVTSPGMLVRQTSPDALFQNLGGTSPSGNGEHGVGEHVKLGVRRTAQLKASSSNGVTSAKETSVRPEDVKPGVPVSAAGLRFVTMPLAEAPFVLQSGLPECQVLWMSRLLPEGRRPTAASIQTVPSAMLAALSEQIEFNEVEGTAFAVFVLRNAVYLAAYREGRLLMFRQCPGIAGWRMLREGVKLRLGIEEEMVDAILDDVIVDPRTAMEPFVRPVLQQLEISLDYLSSRHSMRMDKIFLMGLPSGARYWSQMAEEALHLPLVSPSVFEGMTLTARDQALRDLTPSQSQVFLAALGAARAAMEGQT